MYSKNRIHWSCMGGMATSLNVYIDIIMSHGSLLINMQIFSFKDRCLCWYLHWEHEVSTTKAYTCHPTYFVIIVDINLGKINCNLPKVGFIWGKVNIILGKINFNLGKITFNVGSWLFQDKWLFPRLKWFPRLKPSTITKCTWVACIYFHTSKLF